MSSDLAAVVIELEFADALALDNPTEVSSGLAVATPANSWTSTEVFTTVPRCTVTAVVEAAFGEYHISPSELWPETLKAPIRVHGLPAASVTEVMLLVAPV